MFFEDCQSRISSIYSFVYPPFNSSNLESNKISASCFRISSFYVLPLILNHEFRTYVHKTVIPSFSFKIQGTLKDYQTSQQISILHHVSFDQYIVQLKLWYERNLLFPLLRKLKPPPFKLDFFVLYREFYSRNSCEIWCLMASYSR